VGGATATGGGLVFTAVSGTGLLLALDARSGKTLWSHRFDDRIDAAPSVYSVRGREFVLVALGGSPIASAGWGGYPAAAARFVALTLR
jgi:quinoprotein glucose dehydrogenase